jgi:hypothetical protein
LIGDFIVDADTVVVVLGLVAVGSRREVGAGDGAGLTSSFVLVSSGSDCAPSSFFSLVGSSTILNFAIYSSNVAFGSDFLAIRVWKHSPDILGGSFPLAAF